MRGARAWRQPTMAPATMPSPDEAAALQQDAAQLGCALTHHQTAALGRYLDLLSRWNAIHNLTAVREREAMRVQHLLDCLAVVAPLRRRLGGAAPRLLDVGSGAGLPGVVLAIAWPELDVTCVDPVGKKVAFIRQAQAELCLPNLAAEHARAEQLTAPPFPLIISRALSRLREFVRWTRPLRADGGWWIAMKGQTPDDEIAELDRETNGQTAFHVEHLTVPHLQAARCLVWMQPRPTP